MTSLARRTSPSRTLRAVRGLPRLCLHMLLLAWVLARFLLRARGHYGAVARRGFVLARRLRAQAPPASPLTQVPSPGAGVYRVDAAWLAAQSSRAPVTPADPPAFAAVLHFSATGETRHGPVAALARLLQYAPQLAALPHYVLDAPDDAPAYINANAFGARLWASVEPLVEHSARMLALTPALLPMYERISRPVQILLTSFVLAELGLHDDVNLEWALRDVAHDPPLALSLRSVREFALLTRVPATELQQFVDQLCATLARGAQMSAAIAGGPPIPGPPATGTWRWSSAPCWPTAPTRVAFVCS